MKNPLWKTLTSLRLTVWCLAIGILLVFFGTLAQVHEGLWNAQDRWFRSFFVVRQAGDPWWVMPIFPGGYLLGIVLLVNLIAAHLARFQWGVKKVGIHLTHFGVILLLVGQLLTDMLSVESHMKFREGEGRDYSEAHRSNELVFLTDAADGKDEVVSIPEAIVREKKDITHPKLPFTVRVKEYAIHSELVGHAAAAEAFGKLTGALATVDGNLANAEGLVTQAGRDEASEGRLVVWRAALKAVGENDVADIVAAAKRVAADPGRADKLREDLKRRFRTEMIQRFSMQGGAMQFAARKIAAGETLDADKMTAATADGMGRKVTVTALPEVKSMDARNLPYAKVEIVEGGKTLGEWLLTPYLNDQEITVAGRTYRAAFRFERYYHPFSVTLLKTTHEIYPGTATAANPQGIPRNFQSRVRVTNPATRDNREADIYMNNPLRYGGLTFYQYQMGRDEMAGSEVGTSTLQVVRNPGWLTPYFGCLVVGAGMLWQFLAHLFSFIGKRGAAPPSAPRKKAGRKGAETLEKAGA